MKTRRKLGEEKKEEKRNEEAKKKMKKKEKEKKYEIIAFWGVYTPICYQKLIKCIRE